MMSSIHLSIKLNKKILKEIKELGYCKSKNCFSIKHWKAIHYSTYHDYMNAETEKLLMSMIDKEIEKLKRAIKKWKKINQLSNMNLIDPSTRSQERVKILRGLGFEFN